MAPGVFDDALIRHLRSTDELRATLDPGTYVGHAQIVTGVLAQQIWQEQA